MCRDFLADPIAPEILDEVLAAAFRGPAAGNTWGIELVVLSTRSAVDAMWDVTLPPGPARDGFRWPGLLRAPTLVVPVVEPDAYVARYGEADKAGTGLGGATDDWSVPYWWVDGGAAVMALLLAAEAAELGALLFGQFDREPDVRELLGIPAGYRALGTIALGRPAPGGRAPSRSARRGRPDPERSIHHDRW
jgi:nitroreductase